MPITQVNPRHHGGTVAFEVWFRSDMSGSELELLRRQLAMTSHVEQKLPADPNSPAHAQLDRDSRLLLEHGSVDGQWVLQARTWGRPSERTVHEWRVRVAQVVHQLDAAVVLPEPMPAESYAVSMRPVGHATNTRWAAARRRLVGLP
ncbi:MAG: hypothetical protein ACRDLT_13595 [Solirubrobacteraceae bacterium]